MDHREREAEGRAAEKPQRIGPRERHHDEAHRRAGRHHALDAEVEYPGFFGDEFAHGREDQRGGRGKRARNDEDKHIHYSAGAPDGTVSGRIRRIRDVSRTEQAR